jgi:hypothetical protein
VLVGGYGSVKHTGNSQNHGGSTHYRHLLMMAVLSFAAMYGLMYAMVNTFDNVYPNINQFYMAGLMTAPMVMIELGVMRMMYSDRTLNIVALCTSIVLMFLCWFGIRGQTGIGDRQFLKSMIPHHAGAILMCQKASLADADIKALCSEIVSGQRREIEQMKAKLQTLDSKSR